LGNCSAEAPRHTLSIFVRSSLAFVHPLEQKPSATLRALEFPISQEHSFDFVADHKPGDDVGDERMTPTDPPRSNTLQADHRNPSTIRAIQLLDRPA
jgi:hypothetical protein